MAWTVTESEWDPYELELVHAWMNWRADLHICGLPLTEALHTEGTDQEELVVLHQECRGCRALAEQLAIRAQSPEDKRLREQEGLNPEAWRLNRVMTASQAQQMFLTRGGR